jgi:drug/metabolite transporter (DMT)-like permease
MSAAILWALLAAACFGAGLVVGRRGLAQVTPLAGATVSLPTTCAILWLLSPLLLDVSLWDNKAALIFVVTGLFFPAAATLLGFEANRRMGPGTTGALSGTTPLFATAGAIVFLGEHITPTIIAGTLVVVAGGAILSTGGGALPRTWPMLALVFPLGAACVRAVAQTFSKAAFGLWNNPFAAVLIGYTASAILITAIGLAQGRRAADVPRDMLPWFMAAGFFNGAGLLSMYQGLSTGSVAVVSTVAATFPLFALALGSVFLREEHITVRIAFGIALSVGGVALLLAA